MSQTPYFSTSENITASMITAKVINSYNGTTFRTANVVDEVKELAKWLYATLNNEHLAAGPHPPDDCEVCEVLAEAAAVLE